MYAAYRQIPLAPGKRHLVFGDIHGRHATFTGLLDQVGHDPARDVVCSVGDLIDRGPESVAVIDFFKQPHCHVVRGNHEQMACSTRSWLGLWLDPRNGGDRTLDALERHGRQRDWLEAFCRSLPIVLDVGEEGEPGAFRLVHAESPFEWSEKRLQHYLAQQTAAGSDTSRLLWGREDVTRAWWHTPGPDGERAVELHPERSGRTVFCGHTPVEEVISASGTHWIDTWGGGFMTCVEPATMREHRRELADEDRI